MFSVSCWCFSGLEKPGLLCFSNSWCLKPRFHDSSNSRPKYGEKALAMETPELRRPSFYWCLVKPCAVAVDSRRSCPLSLCFNFSWTSVHTLHTKSYFPALSLSACCWEAVLVLVGPQSLLGCHWTFPPAKCYYFQGAPLAGQSTSAATAMSLFVLLFFIFWRQKEKTASCPCAIVAVAKAQSCSS